MNIDELMDRKVFVVCGDTVNPEKYAYRIKEALIADGHSVYAVGKELGSLDEVGERIEVLDLCIRADRGYELIKAFNGDIGAVIIQPGAGSPQIEALLDERGIPWLNGCVLRALEAKGRL